MMRRVVCLPFVLALAATATAQETIHQRLRALQQEVALLAKAPAKKLASEDLDRLEAVLGHFESLALSDLVCLAAVLRFDVSLQEADLGAVEAFAASDDGAPLRLPLLLVLVGRQRFDAAANLIVAHALSLPPEQRRYATLKWWETTFSGRENYFRMTHELTLALLRRFETAPEAERGAIIDILGVARGTTVADLPALRERSEKRSKKSEEQREKQWQDIDAQYAHKPRKLWIEDHHGLRQVERKWFIRSGRGVERNELRLARKAVGEPAGDWGTLVLPNDYYGDDVGKLYALLGRAVELAADTSGGLVSHRLVAVLYVPRDEENSYTRKARSEILGSAVSDLLSTFVEAADAERERKPADTEQARTTVARGKMTLALVRAAALRIAEVIAKTETDEADDGAVLVPLLIGRMLMTGVAPGANAAGSSFTVCLAGNTVAVVDPESVTIVHFQGGAEPDPGAAYSAIETVRVDRPAFAGASIEVVDTPAGQAPFLLRLTTKQPVRIWTAALPNGVGPAGIRRQELTAFEIRCDTDAHRQDLRTTLQRAAAK